MLDMAKKQIYPAVSAYVGELCANLGSEKGGLRLHSLRVRRSAHQNLATANDNMMAAVQKLESDLADMPEGETEASQRMAHVVVPDMERIRGYADEMEKLCARDYWPFPTYADLWFSVN